MTWVRREKRGRKKEEIEEKGGGKGEERRGNGGGEEADTEKGGGEGIAWNLDVQRQTHFLTAFYHISKVKLFT